MSIQSSLIIPVYNGSKYLGNCFESLIRSNELKNVNVEIIFIDDGSSDSTYELLSLFRNENIDLNIVLIKNTINKGLSFSLNKGIKKASGEYIFRLDVDDRWVDGRLRRSLDLIQNLQKYDHKYVLVGSFMRGLSGRNYSSPIKLNNLYQLLFSSCVYHPTWCISTTILKKYSYEMESPFDDFYLILRILLDDYKIINIPKNLVIYNDIYTCDRITVRKADSRNITVLRIKIFIIRYLISSLLEKKYSELFKIELLEKTKKIISKEIKTNFLLSKLAWLINTVLYKIYFIVYSLSNKFQKSFFYIAK